MDAASNRPTPPRLLPVPRRKRWGLFERPKRLPRLCGDPDTAHEVQVWLAMIAPPVLPCKLRSKNVQKG